MIETFKARLKAKYPSIKFSDKRVNSIADKLNRKFPDVADDAAHDAAIDSVYDEADLAEIVKLDEVLDNAGKPPKPTETTTTVTVEEKPKTEIEKLTEIVTGLATTVQTLTANNQKQTLQQKLKEQLKDVPEKFWTKRVLPEKEEDIATFVTEAKTDYEEIAPEQAYVPGVSARRTTTSKVNEKLINNLVDQAMGIQPQINNTN